MRLPKTLVISILTVLTAFLFFPPQGISAQSKVDLVVHFAEGKPAESEIAYEVSVFLSAVDGSGNPVKDLTMENLTIAEDSQLVEISSLELVQNEPINLVLVMDTSGSMGGEPIAAARTAALNFIADLGEQDEVAVLTFNDTVQNIVDFTMDKTDAGRVINMMESVKESSTCLYDAIYQAAQLTATVPSGSRAVIVFTDGVDEKSSGDACSVHTVEDVIDLASEGSTRTPIYALGLGNRVNTNELTRISNLTGGRDLFSADPSQLDAMFRRLSDQLHAQYILRYTSVAGPGAHTLAVGLNYSNAKDNDTRNFLLPVLPPLVTLLNISEGDEVSGSQQLIAEFTGQSDVIQRVILMVNGEQIATDETTPYEFTVDFGALEPGSAEVTAVVYGAENVELARTLANVTVTTGETQPSEEPNAAVFNSTLVYIGIAGLVLLAGGLAALFTVRNRRLEQESQEAWDMGVAGSGELQPTDIKDEFTDDNNEPSPDALGLLTVTGSDDPSMIGLRFDLLRSVTTLGRSAVNDIIFPKDSSVSRHHAQIEEKRGALYLRRAESSYNAGGAKPPVYETFINEHELGVDPVMLKSGDEIRLGKRVRLKFQVTGQIGRG